MDRTALERYTARVRGILTESPPSSAEETWTWFVRPLLVALGWDLDVSGGERTTSVKGVELAAVLSVETGIDTPAMFVAVEGADDPLSAERIDRIQWAMAETGVDRGIYTSGRRFVLLADDESDRLNLGLDELAHHEDALAAYSADVVGERLAWNTRDLAARRLAVDRDALATALADDLASVAGDSYHAELVAEAANLVDELVASFAGEPPDRSDVQGAHGGGSNADRSASVFDMFEARDPLERESAPIPAADESEYVVRFFNDRSSIGGVGHSNPERAMVHAVEFLFERGLSGVRLPWEPADGADVVLNDEPVLADGSPMPSHHQLSNGHYVNTSGEPDDLAAHVSALAERVGFRAMTSGDWSADD